MEKSAVYFTSDISPEGLMAVYEALNLKDLVQSVQGTIVECNTAYGGSRTETAMHMQVAEDHGFTAIADVDIMDAEGSMELPVEGGTRRLAGRSARLQIPFMRSAWKQAGWNC